MDSATIERREHRLVLAALLALLGVVMVRSAWLCDDAYITFRTVDNLFSGFGPNWNVAERVQAYTHPLWMLLVSAAHLYTGEFYYSVMFLSLAVSLTAAALLVGRLSRGLPAAALATAVLLGSRAFMDYSTSGLENGLSHLLLLLFAVAVLDATRRERNDGSEPFLLGLLAALILLNRMDLALFVLPPLAWIGWRHRSGVFFSRLALGFTPFLAWETFSLFYYGFLFPNTAYAKLGSGLPRTDLVAQGGFYLLDSLSNDPVTLVAIGGGIAAALFVGTPRARALAGGACLYLLYTVWIGGDFMSGRFLSTSLVLATALLVSTPLVSTWRASAPALAVALLLAGMSPHPPILSGADHGNDYVVQKHTVDRNGISDERAFYYPATGLLRAERGLPMPSPRHVWVDAGRRTRESGPAVVVRNSVGLFAFHAGPGIHVIDELGLGEPLLARLPPAWRHDWRIGHFFRVIPAGYRETAASGENRLQDQQLALFYDDLARIVRGPLLAGERWLAILRMNLGRNRRLIDTDRYRYPGMMRVDLAQLEAPAGAAGRVRIPATGVRVALGEISHASGMELLLDRNHDYRIVHFKDSTAVAEQTLWAQPGSDSDLLMRRTAVPRTAVRHGFDSIHVLPETGVGDPRLGPIRLLE